MRDSAAIFSPDHGLPKAERPLQHRIIPDLVSRRVRETPDQVAFCALNARDAWQRVTWKAYAHRVARIATALRVAGLGRGHRAAILAPTSMDWQYTQMACLWLGVSVAGVDPNYPVDQRDEVLRSISIDALFVQDESSAESIPADVRSGLRQLVAFQSTPGKAASGAASLDSLLHAVASSEGLETLAAAEPDDEALVVFSSGTTGRPKPIAYTHRQVLAAVGSILDAYPDIAQGSRLLCWLPLANLFQRIVDFCGIERGATSYVISNPREVMRYLRRAKPHLLIGVPRFYERLHAGIGEKISKSPRPVSALARWAVKTGTTRARAARGLGAQSARERRAARIADRLVLRRLRRIFGRNLRYLVSGSAPMPTWLLDWFEGIGLRVFEAYGVSENIVPVAMNRPGECRLGTVGRPLPGQEVRLAEDKEILVRGPGVFHGYVAAQGAVAPGPDALGFWATGDYGEFDADGFLRLIGRKSEVFKTLAGRWIAPAEIEALLRRPPYVEQAMVLGAGRPSVVAVIAIESTAKVARAALGRLAKGTAELPLQEVDDIIRRDVLATTATLAPYQRPTGVLVTTRRFTIEGGELTSNLKLRRSVVEMAFEAKIQALLAALAARKEMSPERGPSDNDSLLVHWA